MDTLTFPRQTRNRKPFAKGLIVTKAASDDEARQHHLETTYTGEEKAAADLFKVSLATAREWLTADPHCYDDALTDLAERQACFDRQWQEEQEGGVYETTSAYAH